MAEKTFEERVLQFLEEADDWAEARLEEIKNQRITLSKSAIEHMCAAVEENITELIEKGFSLYQDSFIPATLSDFHHFIFEQELKKLGIDNQDQIHRHKENAQVALAVLEGKLKPENALLLMEINRAHQQKKQGNQDGVCDDCVCGRKTAQTS